jgi:hypothetical protein
LKSQLQFKNMPIAALYGIFFKTLQKTTKYEEILHVDPPAPALTACAHEKRRPRLE